MPFQMKSPEEKMPAQERQKPSSQRLEDDIQAEVEEEAEAEAKAEVDPQTEETYL